MNILKFLATFGATVRKRLPMPDDLCPRCEHTALKCVYRAHESYPRPTPAFYLCQNCEARWLKLFSSPLEDASNPKYDYYYGLEVPYDLKGESDNGKDPMEATLYETNWTKCPNCGWRFCLNTASKSGEWPMHTSCGQRLIIKA